PYKHLTTTKIYTLSLHERSSDLEVQSHLESIAAALDNTIRNGSVTDPITDEFILQENPFTQETDQDLSNGEYYLSASNQSLLEGDRKRTCMNSSHVSISYDVFLS